MLPVDLELRHSAESTPVVEVPVSATKDMGPTTCKFTPGCWTVEVPIRTLPALLTAKSVDDPVPMVEEPMIKAYRATVPAAACWIARVASGVVLPTPKRPEEVMWKIDVLDEVATSKSCSLSTPGVPPIANLAEGVEVPTPTKPFWLTPRTTSDGVVLPWLATMKEVRNDPISTASLAVGEVLPIPTKPTGDERVETLMIGTLVELVAIDHALSCPLRIVDVESPL